eukprot:767107-Hanusia_phi.AAC.5
MDERAQSGLSAQSEVSKAKAEHAHQVEGGGSRRLAKAEIGPSSSSGTRRGDDKGRRELQTFELFFPDTSSRLRDFTVNTSWAEACQRVHRLLRSTGDLLWSDGSGNQRKVSDEAGWQDLIEELRYDFAGPRTLDGVVRVKMVAGPGGGAGAAGGAAAG